MPDRTLLDVAREVVAEIAPDEVGDLEFVARAQTAAPGASRRALRSRSEPTASGFTLGGEALSALVVAISAGVAKDLLVLGAAELGSRARSRLALRRERVVPDTVVPAIADADAPAVQAHAETLAADRGADQQTGRTVADALVRKWPRLP